MHKSITHISLPLPPAHTHTHTHTHSLDGIVVAEEYEQVLREAWLQQEQMDIEKEMKKREKRVCEGWRKLTRGVLIRERVKKTYDMVNTAASSNSST